MLTRIWRQHLRSNEYGLPATLSGWSLYLGIIAFSVIFMRHKFDLRDLVWTYGFLSIVLVFSLVWWLPSYGKGPPKRLISFIMSMIVWPVFVMTPAYLLAPRQPQVEGEAHTLVGSAGEEFPLGAGARDALRA